MPWPFIGTNIVNIYLVITHLGHVVGAYTTQEQAQGVQLVTGPHSRIICETVQKTKRGSWVPFDGRTNAKWAGTPLKCPHCGDVKKVYHFAWCASTCQGCDTMIDKENYLIESKA